MPEQSPETEVRSRQEQILMLASEGLTDKEIAAKLRLSPETVGTYWRRILSKYAAASRTEVVAKVVRLQAEAEVGHLTQVSEGLREVADHLLVVLQDQRPDTQERDERNSLAASILEEAPDLIVALDSEGFITFLNRPSSSAIETGEPFEWAVSTSDRDAFRESFQHVLAKGAPIKSSLSLSDDAGNKKAYEVRLASRESGGAVLVLREI